MYTYSGDRFYTVFTNKSRKCAKYDEFSPRNCSCTLRNPWTNLVCYIGRAENRKRMSRRGNSVPFSSESRRFPLTLAVFIDLGSTLPPHSLSSYTHIQLGTTCIPPSSSTNSCEKFSIIAVQTMNTERRWYSWQGAARPGRNLPSGRHGRTFLVLLP